jgi:hypothetical protein
MLKKILYSIWICIIWTIGLSTVLWEDFPYTMPVENPENMQDIVDNSALEQISLDYMWDDFQDKQSPAEYYISTVINYFLWILAFFAFLVLAYWFSMVWTDKTDEWVKKWYKYIKMAIFSIIVIGISWLISIWIFYIYNHNVIWW